MMMAYPAGAIASIEYWITAPEERVYDSNAWVLGFVFADGTERGSSSRRLIRERVAKPPIEGGRGDVSPAAMVRNLDE